MAIIHKKVYPNLDVLKKMEVKKKSRVWESRNFNLKTFKKLTKKGLFLGQFMKKNASRWGPTIECHVSLVEIASCSQYELPSKVLCVLPQRPKSKDRFMSSHSYYSVLSLTQPVVQLTTGTT